MSKKRGRPPKRPISPGIPPLLTEKQREAIKEEHKGVKDWNREPWPSETKARDIAKRIGVTRQIVHRWRKKYPHYKQGLQQEGAVEIEKIRATEALETRVEPPTLKQRAALLHVHVRTKWTGPVVSPIDNKMYRTIDEYVAHLIDEGVVPASKAPDVNQKE